MKNSISLIISLALIFTSNGCFGQVIKLSVRGGTFSPYSLYNTLANKNPYPQINRFTTSEPFCLGTGISYESKNRYTYGINATYRKVNIQLLNAFNSFPLGGTWENYDFDCNLGYKIITTPKSSLCAILGLGMQKRLEYATGNSQKQYANPDSIEGISSSDIEIKTKKALPVFMLLKLEAAFALSHRWDLFLNVESNVFFTCNYFLSYENKFIQNDNIYEQGGNGIHFSNNSISSSIGFKYALFKPKKVNIPT